MRNLFQRLTWVWLLVLAIGASASAQDNATISGAVTTRSDGRAVAGAVVSIVGNGEMTTTDSNGRYALDVPLSASHRASVQLKIDALGLPSKVVEVVIDRPELTVGQPHDNLKLGGNWQRQRAGVDLNFEQYGTFCSVESANPADDQQYGAKWLTDIEGSYRLGGYRLAVGAQNLFDVFPDRNSTVNSFNGIETFPRHSPFGMNGRTLYARIGWTF